MAALINPPSHYYLHLFLQLVLLSRVNSQQCQRTPEQPEQHHSCPFYSDYSQEAYTIETFRHGTSFYQKECCDARGVAWNRAAIKGCIATKCVPYHNPDPCKFLPRYIINNQYVPYEAVKRDHCENHWGQVAMCCPPNSQANLIASAYGAEMNEFPHMARLETEDEICAGTVYNYDTVITAAHCVVDKQGNHKNPRTFRVILGVNIVTSGSGAIRQGRNVYRVENAIVHPGYSLHRGQAEFSWRFGDRRAYNDIALLQLQRNIDFSGNIRALPIAPEHFKPERHGGYVTIVGWGTGENGMVSHYLQKANVLVRRDEQCFKGFFGGGPYPNYLDFKGQFHCFGGIVNGEYSAVAGKGHSGGPAICRGPEGYAVLCGVMSLGRGDENQCRRNADEYSCPPSLYTDVSYFRDWIISNAGPQDWGSVMWRKPIFGEQKHWSAYPHQVKIVSEQGPINCGGTLIARDTVITAGHCIFTINRGMRGGLQAIAWDGRVFDVRHWGRLLPGGFARYGAVRGLKTSSFQGHSWIDNLAIVKLDGEVPISLGNIPSLPDPSSEDPPHVMEFAWLTESRKSEPQLVRRQFKTLKTSECKRRLDRLQLLGAVTNWSEMDSFLCGVEEYSGGGICERTLGGGVICPGGNGGAGILCGVQTFRFCDLSMPTPFVRVNKYLDLIARSI